MRKSRRLVATLAVLNLILLWRVTVFGATPTAAQQPQGSPIAVVDIGHIFNNHAQFKKQMETLGNDVRDIQQGFKDEEKDVVKQREKLQTYNAGSPEYKKLEESIARQISDMQVRKQLKQKESREREAKLFYDTYMEVSREINRLANQFGLDLVLRFESQEIDPSNPASVTNGLNRNVIYQRQLDLTPHVLESLNKGTASIPNGRPPGPNRPANDKGSGRR